MQIILVK
jgi:hypothetical protein